MNLKPCKTCGQMIAKNARVCPNCGQKYSRIGGCLAFVIIFIVVSMVIGYVISNLSQKGNESIIVSQPAKLIPYEIIRKWQIPNGGFGSVIVVSPQYRNEQDLRELGQNLRYDTRNDRNAFIDVFDNKKAAGLSENIANLSEKEGALFDKHKIGQYTRNINTGYHRFQIWVNGLNSESITVDYSK